MKKAIFLDRDGTLIEDKVYLNNPDDILYLPGVFEGMKMLAEAGFDFVIATNQSGVPRGLVQIENLHEIHRRMEIMFATLGIKVNKFYFAPHPVDSNHPDRKPSPGMLNQAIKEHGFSAQGSWMIGDRMSDVEAGHRAHMKSILLAGNENPAQSDFAPPDYLAPNFLDAARYIIQQLDNSN